MFQKCSSKLAVPGKGGVDMHMLPSQGDMLFGTRGCGSERARELWLQEHVCEWGSGYIAKDRESEIIQDIARELGKRYRPK